MKSVFGIRVRPYNYFNTFNNASRKEVTNEINLQVFCHDFVFGRNVDGFVLL